MRRFHGDLLMGGVAIRELDGMLEDDEVDHPEGSFEVEPQQQSLLELGRPYLLMLDDGDAVKVVVKGIDETSDASHCVVQFEALD